MKKKYTVSSKEKKDWIDFTNQIGNIYPKEVDFLQKNAAISKVRIAEIFYQQTHVKDPFDFDPNENSLFGYNLGLDMADNMVFLLKGRKAYVPSYDSESNLTGYDSIRTTQVETQILF